MILLEMIRLKGESIISIFSTDTKIIHYNIEAIAIVSGQPHQNNKVYTLGRRR